MYRVVAAYTAGIYLPTPYTIARYWHRPLKVQKLIDVRFSYLPTGKTLEQEIDRVSLPEQPKVPGFRPMREEDIPQCLDLIGAYLQKTTKVHPNFSKEDFTHWFSTRKDIINTFVVEVCIVLLQ